MTREVTILVTVEELDEEGRMPTDEEVEARAHDALIYAHRGHDEPGWRFRSVAVA